MNEKEISDALSRYSDAYVNSVVAYIKAVKFGKEGNESAAKSLRDVRARYATEARLRLGELNDAIVVNAFARQNKLKT